MMEFSFELATQKDDPEIRHLLANSAMPGRITVTFEREPDYFLGCDTMGHFWQVLIARHRPSGELAAIMCRGSQPRFVNGQIEDVGYIGQIRVADQYRGRGLIPRGFPFFQELHADGRVSAYLGVISDENEIARRALVDRARSYHITVRAGARIHTLGIVLGKHKPLLASDYRIDRASREDLGSLVAFLRQCGAAKQFFPAYTESDFEGRATTRGFDVRDFVVARRQGRIVGTIGIWDQSGYKQTVVQSYHGSLRWLRPLYNLGARLTGIQPLPASGEHIRSAYASFVCVAENDPRIFGPLLRHAYNLATRRGLAYLMIGLTEQDPLLAVAQEYAHIAYHSRMYVASWEGAEDFGRLDERVPYIEIAAL